jgi:hypothetical protein
MHAQGQWVKGQYHGRGKYSWPDGRSYEGEWQENKMHGQGVYTDINGHRWVKRRTCADMTPGCEPAQVGSTAVSD